MIASIEFFLRVVRVRFLDGTAVDVSRECWRYRSTDADIRRMAARVALQARAAHCPEAELFRDLERRMLAVSQVCYTLYDRVRRGESAMWDYWRFLILQADPPPPDEEMEPGSVKGTVPQQIGKLTARLHRLAMAAGADIFERITFLDIVYAAHPDHKPDHDGGRPHPSIPTKLSGVATFYPAGTEPPAATAEMPAQRRRRLRGPRPAASLPPSSPAAQKRLPAAGQKLLPAAKAAGKKS